MAGVTRTRRFLRALRRSKGSGVFDYLALALGGLVHPDLLRSGITAEEGRRGLPGDELVRNPMWEATRAITIDAPVDDVWPWVAQMGYGRGGWYGWNPLEGADTGVDRLLTVDEPSEGDVWLDGPGCNETKGAWVVKTVDKPRTLVLYTLRDPVNGRELQPGTSHRPWIQSGWSFHLLRSRTASTRLLVRTRVVVRPRWALLPLKWMGAGDTVMQRRLLVGIKIRSERDFSTQPISTPGQM
jgi:hypothetical protein